jgi:hypothetical protein
MGEDVRSTCTTKVTSYFLPTIPILAIVLGLPSYLHLASSRFKDCSMSTKLADSFHIQAGTMTDVLPNACRQSMQSSMSSVHCTMITYDRQLLSDLWGWSL